MRSKCRCSCVLQFTRRRAVSCVLHRPTSQVIHCAVLYSLLIRRHFCPLLSFSLKQNSFHVSFNRELYNPETGGERTLSGLHRTSPNPSHRPNAKSLTVKAPRSQCCSRTQTGEQPTAPPICRRSSERGGLPRGCFDFLSPKLLEKPIMILPQVHLRKPCYDFYFL